MQRIIGLLFEWSQGNMQRTNTMHEATRLISSTTKVLFWGLLIWLIAVPTVRFCLSQALTHDQSVPEPLTSHTVSTLDAQETEAFFDEIIPQQLNEYHVPGAAIAVVKDGK
jgi:hypothetical protein